MSTSLPSTLAQRRRFLGVARLTLIFALAAASLASAQVLPGPAASAGSAASGRRGAGVGRNGAAAFAPGAATAAAAQTALGRRGTAGRGIVTPAAVPAGTATAASFTIDTIPAVVGPNTTPGAVNPANVPGALVTQPNGQIGPATPGATAPVTPAGTVALTVLNPDDLVETVMPNVNAQNVLEYLQRNTDQVILISQTLPQVVINYSTITGSGTHLPRSRIVSDLENLLAMDNVIIVPNSGNTVRAIPANNLSATGMPIVSGPDVFEKLAAMEPSEKIYGAIFPLKYLNPVTDIQGTLSQFMSSSGSSIVILPRDNSILVTDMLINLQRVAEVIKTTDVPVTPTETIIYKVLKNAQAQALLTSLTALDAQTSPLYKYFGTSTTFTTDARTNAVVVVTAKSNEMLVNSLVDSFDQNVDPTTSSDVYRLKQADSGNLSTILKAIVTGSQQSAATPGAARGGPAPAPTVSSSSQQFSQYVTITNDVRTNSIVAYGTPTDLKQIQDLIAKIDIILPEVQIDAVVTEVTLTKDQVSGLSNFAAAWDFIPASGTTPGANTTGDRNFATSALTPTTGAAPAFTLAGSLTSMNLNAVLNVAKTDSNVKVIDSPSIVTTHAQRGYISVGQRVPISTGSTTVVTTPPSTTNTISYETVSVLMTITPFIGVDGSVYMSIDQQVNDILGNVQINGVAQPIIGTRELTANVTVHDGGILVLGGLRERRETTSHGVVFLLGEIPIFGQLFQPDEHETTVTELIVFIQPHIIKDTPNDQYLARQVPGKDESQDTSVTYMRARSLQNSAMDKPGSSTSYVDDQSSNTVIHPENYPTPVPPNAPPPANSAPPPAEVKATNGTTSSSSNSDNSSTTPQPIDTSGGFKK